MHGAGRRTHRPIGVPKRFMHRQPARLCMAVWRAVYAVAAPNERPPVQGALPAALQA